MTNHANYVPNNFIAATSDPRFGGMAQSRLDSENEDLRGVIDDLTIENKRLKQMVRTRGHHRQTSSSDVLQQQDRLFEVRMHGLPPDERRELEHLLKKFAASIHDKSAKRNPASLNKTTSKSSSSSTNFMGNKAPQTDSGYASVSNSNSAPLSSGLRPLSEASPATTTTHRSSNNKAVKNYLKDIPDTLLPKQNPAMSERAKSALVVRRLEQLFTGRNAAPGDHDQPRQQQEISNSAAQADRLQDTTNSRKRKAEGPREARVMAPDTKVNLDAINHFDKESTYSPITQNKETGSNGRLGSPDQRPTRPLDLDVYRAQVATENIQYLRHLGMPFFPPSEAAQSNDDNWIYLNLLAGLAQLHTMNVTPEFIRRAVKKLSKKFELSKDGYRVRWIGGADETQFTMEDEKAIEVVSMGAHESTEDIGSGRSSDKRSQSNSTSNPVDTSTSGGKTSALQTSSDSKQQPTTSGLSHAHSPYIMKPVTQSSAFDYKPIVYKGRILAEYEESYLRDSDDSFDSQSGDSCGLVRALSKSNLSTKGKEEGTLTFFNNPFFFSDFSADQDPSNVKKPRPVIVGETLGIVMPADISESPLRFSDATYFATEFAAKPFQIRSPEDEKMLQFTFPDLEPIQEAGEYESMPLDFEVSGLGGVTPQDNFALDVKTTVTPAALSRKSALNRRRPFSRRSFNDELVSQVTFCEKIDLLPSKLPPPSYIFFTSSSSSDAAGLDEDEYEDDSDGSSDTSSPLIDETFPAPPAFLQQFTAHSDEENTPGENDEIESSEIDMLAMARKVNPREIAEQERVFAINQPGGPNVAAVEGSLAATVGASRSGASVPEEAEDAEESCMSDISSDASKHGSQDETDKD